MRESTPLRKRILLLRDALCLGLLLATSLAGHADAGERALPSPQQSGRGAKATAPRPSHMVGGYWFQKLTPAQNGEARWLFPHMDGVFEVFRAPRKKGEPWEGDLESRFDPKSGSFANLFNAASVLNELLYTRRTMDARRAAARLLQLFMERHGGERPPYYLRQYLGGIKRYLRDEEREWIAERQKRFRDALSGNSRPGTTIRALARPISLTRGPDEYYRRMIQDGYLDIAVIGGNLYDENRGTYHSWEHIENLRKEALRMGFRPMSFRTARDRTLAVRNARLLGQNITMRMQFTGGSSRPYRINRGVANFVEGLAHADIVIYHGHSNRGSGSYYVSETGSLFSKFRIGMRGQEDLREKCHSLKKKPYQILGLQSCSSYPKYCRPIRWYYEEQLAKEPGSIGVIGHLPWCCQADLVPRYKAFIAMLIEGRGAREMLTTLNGIRPEKKTPNMILRAVLQPRFTFVVPRGVEIKKVEEMTEKDFCRVYGTGSDDKRYVSTELFAQDRLGEVVQVVSFPHMVYGLMTDGRLFEVSKETNGSMVEARFTRKERVRFYFIGQMRIWKRPKLVLIGSKGRLYRRDPASGRLCLDRRQPQKDLQFVAVGDDAEGRFVGQDKRGRYHAWNGRIRRYEPIEGDVRIQDLSPSLLGHGLQGFVWSPDNAGSTHR